MEKSYQLLPLVGVNQAPNQLANVEVVRMMVVDTSLWVIGSCETSVHGTLCWFVVNTSPVGQSLEAVVDWLVCWTVIGFVGRQIRRLLGGPVDRSVYWTFADTIGHCDVRFRSVLAQCRPWQDSNQSRGQSGNQ